MSCAPQKTPEPPDTRSSDETAIRDADTAWSKTSEAKDVDALVAYFANDAVSMPANAPIQEGKEAIRKGMANMFALPGVAMTWQPGKVEVARSGDIGYSRGTYEFRMTDSKGQLVMEHGKYLTVWKKQADGNWKVAADTLNSDMPPAPPPTTK